MSSEQQTQTAEGGAVGAPVQREVRRPVLTAELIAAEDAAGSVVAAGALVGDRCMTFDEWMLTVAPTHKPSDDSVSLRILRRCWKASEAAERERISSALMKMHERDKGRHNYWHCAVVELFWPNAKVTRA